MKKTLFIFGVGLCLIVALSGCQNQFATEPTEMSNTETTENQTNDDPAVGIANPASANCIEKGGTLEIRTNKLGEYGICLFEDNRQCEEWALFRDQCPIGGVKITGYQTDAEIFCAITGGRVEIIGDATMCKRFDGTYCNAQSNFDGDCPDPNDPEPNAGNMEI